MRQVLQVIRHSQLARHVAPLWGAEGVVLLTGLVQALVVARVLGPREYGVIALTMALPTLLFTFFDPQAYESVVRYVNRFVGEGDPDRAAAVSRLAYTADGVLAFIGLAMVVAIAPWVADRLLRAPDAAELVIVYAVGLCAGAPLSTSRAVLTSFDRFRMVATVTSSAAVVRTALVVALVVLGWGASGVIYGIVVGMFVEAAMMSVVSNRVMRAVIGRSWRSVPTAILGGERRAILSFMLHTELVSLAGALVKHADVVILGAASGPQAAGHYRLAWQIVGPLTRIALPLQEVFYTQASRLAAVADWDGLRQLIRRRTKAIGIPLAGLVLLGIPVVMLAIPRIAGRDYAAAVAPAAFLLLAAAAALALFWLRPAYLASGLVRPLLLISTMTAAASLAGFLVAAPVAGATGVAGVRALVTGIAGGAVAAAYLLWKVTDRTAIHPARSPQEAAA